MSVPRMLVKSALMILLYVTGMWAAGSDLADAVMNKNSEAVRTLLAKKADVNAAQTDGATALHWAVRWDDVETVNALIQAGANVNAANREGATPLSLASVNANPAVLERLLQAGANPNAT